MNKYLNLLLIACCICLGGLKNACAQTAKSDTITSAQIGLDKARAYFRKNIGVQLPLYNGTEYYLYNPIAFRGSAYFLGQKTYMPGAVNYDGDEYQNVQLLYDMYKDELVTVLYNNYSIYTLVKGKVKNFDLLDHHFVNIDADTLKSNPVIKSGYYDELYHGKAQVLSKRYTDIQNFTSTTGANEAYSYFTDIKEDFYIQKGSSYYKISGQGSLLDVLKDKKKELQQYIKTNKIKFGDNLPQALVKVTAYYDSITN